MNWHERIKAARERGRTSREDKGLVISWRTCGCGEQDARIPRNHHGAPKDARLGELGIDFSFAILLSSFDKAEQWLEAIEKRSAEIIAAM